MKSILRVTFLFLWIGTTCSFSQKNSQLVKEITVYFESASSVISKAEAIKMAEAIQSLTDSHLYSIELTAHTDSEGSSTYNDNLSAQRAKSVADFLVNKGFFSRKISFVAQGEHQPIAENETDSGKAQNRRVTVKIQKKFDDKLSVGGFTIEEKYYTFSAENQQKIEHPSGTVIDIPENAFVDKNGNPITGDVRVSYIEYRDPVDFILGNIPMDYHQDGEKFVFNSGGMFKIKATHQGEEVFLGKDKNINLDFPLTENLPDLNFYFFDEKTNKWIEKSKNITANVEQTVFVNLAQFYQMQPIAFDSISVTNRSSNLDKTCYQISQSLKMGKLFATSTDSLYTKINLVEREMEPYNLTRKKTVEYQISTAKKAKKTHLIHLKSYDVKCTLSTNDDATIKFVSKTNSYLGKLNDIHWISNKSSEKYNLKTVSLIGIKKLDDNLYTITIKDSLGEQQLDSLRVANLDEQKKIIVTNISSQINNRQIQYKKREESVKKQDLILGKKKRELSRIKKVKYSTRDSIMRINYVVDRFWDFNKPLMTPEEIKMTKEDWIDYFDQNKELMLKRYAEYEDKEVLQCLERVKEMERAQKNRVAINSVDTSVRQRLSISSFGIYNCDQIQRLFEPLIVYVDYSDQQNNKIIPIFIYIIDEKINGLLKYDGYMGYSPNRFAYSPKSKTTLLAFDADGNAYIYSKEKMKQLDTNKTRHLFVLEKINDISNKDELAALLN